MTADATREKAKECAKRAGVAGEEPLALVDGPATSGAGWTDDTLGDLVPGLSSLLSEKWRLVLVTDAQVHLFKGKKPTKPGARLASYPLGPGVMDFDGRRLTFPDGQVVFLTAHKYGVLAAAAAVDENPGTPQDVLDAVGISGELGLVVARGHHTKSAGDKSVGTKVFDATLGGGELDFRRAGESRIVLVTDRNVYLFEGLRVAHPGPLRAKFATGTGPFTQAGGEVLLPDGSAVAFESAAEARRVAEAAAGQTGS